WDQVVFVLPAFEVRAGTRVPRTKVELRELWDSGDARPFYGTLCPRCQHPTDYGRWWALPPTSELRVAYEVPCQLPPDYGRWWALPPTSELRVAYEVPWRDPWEPFYVGSTRGVPPFDERFLQYGFNRISQVTSL
ncbi:N-acetyllactosaminide beta-1,3-N-acetylglucosaminyltransferase, partial [Antrostomus carolinensis]